MARKSNKKNIVDQTKTDLENKDTIKEDMTTDNSSKESKKISKKKDTVNETKKQEQWKPDLSRMICLKNIARGGLIYKSKRQLGYTIEWDKPGDTNYIELGEFINLKNTNKRFVTEPWVRVIEDDEIEILKYANILQYYKSILSLDNPADILQLDFPSFKEKFDQLPKGYKNSIATKAAEMIKNGQLDSIKIKNYIEKELDLDLSILTSPQDKNLKSTTLDVK